MLLFIWHPVPSLCLPNDDDFKESVCHYLAITTCSHSVHLFNKSHSHALKSPLMIKRKRKVFLPLINYFFLRGWSSLWTRGTCVISFLSSLSFSPFSPFPIPLTLFPSWLEQQGLEVSGSPAPSLSLTACCMWHTVKQQEQRRRWYLFWFLQLPVMCLDDGAKCWLFSPL